MSKSKSTKPIRVGVKRVADGDLNVVRDGRTVLSLVSELERYAKRSF